MARKKSKKDKGTQISISLPKDLVKLVDEMAAADNRTRSNFIAKVMSDLARTRLSQE